MPMFLELEFIQPEGSINELRPANIYNDPQSSTSPFLWDAAANPSCRVDAQYPLVSMNILDVCRCLSIFMNILTDRNDSNELFKYVRMFQLLPNGWHLSMDADVRF